MICKNCNSNIPDGSLFCKYCGAKVEAEQPAYAYQAQAPAGQDNYGTAPQAQQINQYAQMPVMPQQNQQPVNAPVKEKKGSKKALAVILIILGVILVAAAAVAAVLIFGGNNKDEEVPAPLIYTTDSELFVIESLGKDAAETFMVTNDFAGDYMLSADYKYIVYSTNRQEFDDDYDGYKERSTYDLYYKKIGDDKDEGTLIVKGASSLDYVKGSIEAVYYAKNDDVYTADMTGESTKVASGTSVVTVTEDGNNILCSKYISGDYDEESDTYGDSYYELQIVDVAGGNAVSLSKYAENFTFEPDCSTICFIENGKLYSSDIKGETKALADDVSGVEIANGNIYYTCLDKEYSYYDFVNDTYVEADKGVTEPNWDDYVPDIDDYEYEVYDDFWEEYYYETDYDAYYEAYDAAEERYDAAWEKYDAASERNYLRDELKDDSYYESYSLYIYKNGKGEKLCENLVGSYISRIPLLNEEGSCDSVRVTTYKTPLAEIGTIDITDVYEEDDVWDFIGDRIDYIATIADSSGAVSLDATGKNLRVVNVYYDSSQYVLALETTVYDEDSENYNTSAVYTLPSNAAGFDEATLVAGNISSAVYYKNGFITYDDFNSNLYTATMNVDGQEINNATPGTILYEPNGEGFYFASDYNKNTYTVTINKYSNGKVERIIDDAVFYYGDFAVRDGKCLAITNYDDNRGSGTLVCIDGENKYEIDNGVRNVFNSGLELSYTMPSEEY